MAAIIQQWRNNREYLYNPSRAEWHDAARKILDSIDAEWLRRACSPNPDDWFLWPKTDAPGGSGSLDASDWLAKGLLKFMGYSVGRTSGVRWETRRAILSGLFDGQVPPVFPPTYLQQWGEPQSAMRLKKMAESLAAFTRSAKRRRDDAMFDAIRDWENDLNFLHAEYYVGHFHFAWPSTVLCFDDPYRL